MALEDKECRNDNKIKYADIIHTVGTNSCEINSVPQYQTDTANRQLSRLMTKPTKWHVRPAKPQISLCIAQSDQSLRCPQEESLHP